MLIDLLEPVLNVIEGLLICAVIDQNNTHSSLVVSLGDRPESFLSCSVPYLQLDAFVVNVNLFDLKVNPYRVINDDYLINSYRWWAYD